MRGVAQAAARAVRVEYEPLPACLGIDQAIAEQRFHLPPAKVERGDVAQALASAPHRLQGEVRCGGQDHFYLETHASWVEIDGDGLVQVTSSTQHPSETQAMVAHVLGLPRTRWSAAACAWAAASAARKPRPIPSPRWPRWRPGAPAAPVAIQLVRSLDMQLTGKRHPFLGRFDIGFDDDGLLQAMDVDLVADGGWSCDLSPPVLMRAMVHVDNAYYCPHVRVIGRIAKTHTTSNTAFRGFGGPQGMLVGEEIVDRIARHLGLPPEVVRERNFYREGQQPARDTTHYGQPVADNHMADLWAQLMQRSEFARAPA
jgi:xanthine dehydrogenase large subunit